MPATNRKFNATLAVERKAGAGPVRHDTLMIGKLARGKMVVAAAALFSSAVSCLAPANSQIYPDPVTGKVPATDVYDPFNPSLPSSPRDVSVWKGTIVTYRVIDSMDGIPQRTELGFQRYDKTSPTTIYVRMPLYVDGKKWDCPSSTSKGLYIGRYSVCPGLPPEIVFRKTTVQVNVWFVPSALYFGQTVPATNSIMVLNSDISPIIRCFRWN